MENQDKYNQLSLNELIKERASVNSETPQENIDLLDNLIASKQPLNNNKSTRPRESKVKFHGNPKEYFSIWIVNLLLSIVTLGIYSAWAKVRTQRYFHANTEVDGHRFSYLASPIQILKGRIIAVAVFASFYFISSLTPAAGGALMLLYFIAAPWLICKSIKFNMQMVGYRNIRFNFHGQYGQAFLVFILYPILSVFTLYLTFPLVLRTIDKFLCNNMTYGDKPFSTDLSTSEYYKAALGAVAIGVVLFTFAIISLGLEFAMLAEAEQQSASLVTPILFAAAYVFSFIIAGAFYTKIVRNHLFANTQIEGIAKFKSSVSLPSLTFLRLTNLLALICTLGLALPWVRIRNSHYFSQATSVIILPGADAVVANQSAGVNAIGDEVAEAFDLDVALG